jgi:hypothetical protein
VESIQTGKGEERGSGFVESIYTDKTPAAVYLYWSILKKSRHLGFGGFIDIWFVGYILSLFHEVCAAVDLA